MPGVDDPQPDRIDRLAAQMEQLIGVVGALAETVALQADIQASAPAAAPARTELHADEGHLPLVPLSADNKVERLTLAHELGVLGTPGGDALLAGGARGFFRGLDREEGQLAITLPRAWSVRLIEEATLEDPREAIEMGHELLKVWDSDEPPVPGVDPPTVLLDKHGAH